MKKYFVWLALFCLYASPVGFVALTGCGKDGAAEKISTDDLTEEEKAKEKSMEEQMKKYMKEQEKMKNGGMPGAPGGPGGPGAPGGPPAKQ